MRLPQVLPYPRPTVPELYSGRARTIAAVAIAALLIVSGVVIRSSLFGGGSEATASEQLVLLRQQSAPLIVYTEFGYTEDVIWAADPADPSRRAGIATVEHAPGYAITASLSPDGAYLAYVLVPSGAPGHGSAQLWVIDLEAQSAMALADQVDLLTAPKWNPTGDAVVARSVAGGANSLILVDLTGATTVLAGDAEGLYPIEFAKDGSSLYYAAFSSNGADLAQGGLAGQPLQTLGHLGEGLSRDWSLSPDGERIAFLGQTTTDRLSFDARVFDLTSGAVQGSVAGISGSQFGPVWDPDGGLTVGSAPDAGTAGASVHISSTNAVALPPPSTGFDVPLCWAPDGGELVVRNFEGSSASDPGASHVVVIDATGARLQLSPESNVTVAGWLE